MGSRIPGIAVRLQLSPCALAEAVRDQIDSRNQRGGCSASRDSRRVQNSVCATFAFSSSPESTRPRVTWFKRAVTGARTSPRGFTLVELLIVLAIIGLLVSLSVPAIQASREAARRTQCTSNFRQIGIALVAYHDLHKVFPPTVIWHPAGEPLGNDVFPPGVIDRLVRTPPEAQERDRVYANWLYMLLPLLEESALQSQFDFKVPVGHARNETARATDVWVLKCPSDAYSGAENHYQRKRLGEASDNGYARANYAMNMGTNDWCLMGTFSNPYHSENCTDGFWVDGTDLATNVRQVWGSGIGGVNKSFAAREFPSGLSKMVGLDEIRAGVNSADPRGAWALGFVGSSITAGHGTYGLAPGPNSTDAKSDAIGNCKAARVLAGGAYELAAMGMGCNPTIDDGASFQAGARSLHPGGVNLLMLDGSVHFVVDNIDTTVWHNMHRRDNRVPIELPF